MKIWKFEELSHWLFDIMYNINWVIMAINPLRTNIPFLIEIGNRKSLIFWHFQGV